MAVNNRVLLKVIKFYTAMVARACALQQHVKDTGEHMWTDIHGKVHTVKTSSAPKHTSITDSEKAKHLFTVVACVQIHPHNFIAQPPLTCRHCCYILTAGYRRALNSGTGVTCCL